MTRQRHLRRAPITEALIDLRVKLPAEKQNPTLIQDLHNKIREQFPQEKEIRDFQVEFEVGHPPHQKTKSSHVGYRYDSHEGRRVVQAKVDGFTFSWLKPYEDWGSLRREAHAMWELYRELMQPDAITRVATRFINQIEIPGPLIDFDHYLTAAPVILKALPQVLGSFLTRIVVPDERNQITAIITQMFQPGANKQAIPVVLDIDFKNLAFFDSITEKTTELFE